jgi:hypothetical protein
MLTQSQWGMPPRHSRKRMSRIFRGFRSGHRARSPEREGAGSTVTAIGLHALSAENFRNSGAAKTSMTSPARGEGPRFIAELAKAELDGQDCAMRKIVRR